MEGVLGNSEFYPGMALVHRGIFEQFRGAKNRELEQTLEQHNKVQKQLYVAPS